MKFFRPRFSLKVMLVAVTLVAIGSYVLVLPTVRAERFAKLINTGELNAAIAMLPDSIDDASMHRRTVQHAIGAAVVPLMAGQLFHGERRVIVTEKANAFGSGIKPDDSDEGFTAEFIVYRTTIAVGWHSFYQW